MLKFFQAFSFFTIFACFVFPSKVFAQTITLTPEIDTAVRSDDTNYGTSDIIRTSSFDSSRLYITLLKFNTSGYSLAQLTDAKLILTTALDREVTKTFHLGTSATFGETGITFATATQLASGSLLGTLQTPSNTRLPVGEAQTISLNVSILKGVSGNSLPIIINNSAGDSSTYDIYSKEHANSAFRPKLQLTFGGTAPTSTPVSSTQPTPTSTPRETSQAVNCRADINQDEIVDIDDYGYLVEDFFTTNERSNIDQIGLVDISDYSILVSSFFASCPRSGATASPVATTTASPRATNTPTPTPRPTNTPIPTPTAGPTGTPLPASSYLWISPTDIKALPITGDAETAWNRVVSEANALSGSADLSNLNSVHDTRTLAAALYAVRMNDDTMRNKVVAALKSAEVSGLSRALELSRGLQSYVIAADIIDYRDQNFKNWVREMMAKDGIGGHVGDEGCNTNSLGRSALSTKCNQAGVGDVYCTAINSMNNWGGHARAAGVAAALYLNDQAMLNDMIIAHRTFIGHELPNTKNYAICTSKSSSEAAWHADQTNRYGVNKDNTFLTYNGVSVPVSGVLPEDWRRDGNASGFRWPPADTNYIWEGMEGYTVAAVLLHRAGKVDFKDGSNSLVRALKAVNQAANGYGSFPGNPDFATVSSKKWMVWLINKYGIVEARDKFPVDDSVTEGRGMGFTNWTHR